MTYAPDITTLWVVARVGELGELGVTDWPEYGSVAWHLLPPTHPARYAAVLVAAERWRTQEKEQARLDQLADEDPEAWYAEVFGDARAVAARTVPALRAMRTAREIKTARARPRPVHQLRATPGWPPIAVPGEPGRLLTVQEAA